MSVCMGLEPTDRSGLETTGEARYRGEDGQAPEDEIFWGTKTLKRWMEL